jgi:hypothetical protein
MTPPIREAQRTASRRPPSKGSRLQEAMAPVRFEIPLTRILFAEKINAGSLFHQ